MKKAFLSILFMAIVFASCTTTRVANINSTNTKVQIFVSTLPEKTYQEIAYLQCDGGIFNTPQQLLNGLTKKAEQLNANAIIKVKYDFQGIWPVASAVAIKYK
ncbi:MAG: hypothetical protein ACK4ON_01805 [Bacteroidia bacterium]